MADNKASSSGCSCIPWDSTSFMTERERYAAYTAGKRAGISKAEEVAAEESEYITRELRLQIFAEGWNEGWKRAAEDATLFDAPADAKAAEPATKRQRGE